MIQVFSSRTKASFKDSTLTANNLKQESKTKSSDPISCEVKTEDDYKGSDDMATFSTLGLSDFLVKSLAALSIHAPTAIQKACIPQILSGKNVIGSAKTGSGKTAAFALPIIEKLSKDPFGVFALVLTPTRELAYQIAEQFKALSENISFRQSVVVGGVDMMKQALELKKRPHVVVATPGRLADLIKSCPDAACFSHLRFLVLDEADRMLEETFADDLSVVLEYLPSQDRRQTLLFSATMTPAVESLRKANTFVYKMQERHDTVAKLDQRYILTPSLVRDSYLVWILKNICKDYTTIIFVGKCKVCELLRFMLMKLEFKVTALHSQMTQNQRVNSLARFRSHICPILIATDVGSRGLDIPEVRFVVNYDIPCSATDYVHRVGRTARAGRGGKAINLMTEFDVDLILNIENKIKKKLELEEVNEKEINEQLKVVAEAKREASLYLLDSKFGENARINKIKHERGGEDGKKKDSLKNKKRIRPE